MTCETCDTHGPELPSGFMGQPERLELHRALHQAWSAILKPFEKLLERICK